MTSIPQTPAHDQHDSTDILTDSAIPLPALPPFARWLLGQFLAPILAWLGALLAHHLTRQCAHHPLARIYQAVDLSPTLAVCAAYYY